MILDGECDGLLRGDALDRLDDFQLGVAEIDLFRIGVVQTDLVSFHRGFLERRVEQIQRYVVRNLLIQRSWKWRFPPSPVEVDLIVGAGKLELVEIGT